MPDQGPIEAVKMFEKMFTKMDRQMTDMARTGRYKQLSLYVDLSKRDATGWRPQVADRLEVEAADTTSSSSLNSNTSLGPIPREMCPDELDPFLMSEDSSILLASNDLSLSTTSSSLVAVVPSFRPSESPLVTPPLSQSENNEIRAISPLITPPSPLQRRRKKNHTSPTTSSDSKERRSFYSPAKSDHYFDTSSYDQDSADLKTAVSPLKTHKPVAPLYENLDFVKASASVHDLSPDEIAKMIMYENLVESRVEMPSPATPTKHKASEQALTHFGQSGEYQNLQELLKPLPGPPKTKASHPSDDYVMPPDLSPLAPNPAKPCRRSALYESLADLEVQDKSENRRKK